MKHLENAERHIGQNIENIHNNEDEDNSLNTFSDKNYQDSSEKYR